MALYHYIVILAASWPLTAPFRVDNHPPFHLTVPTGLWSLAGQVAGYPGSHPNAQRIQPIAQGASAQPPMGEARVKHLETRTD
jgi:hypothetical protein